VRDYEGRGLLVTGATGIAAATVRLAAARGARVFVVSRDAGECEALCAEVAAAGGGAAWQAADVSDAAAVDVAVRRGAGWLGRLDACFHVAGISGRRFGDGPVHEATEEGWDATFAVNARGTFLVSRAVVRHMLVQDPGPLGLRGALLLMSSVLASSPEPRHFATHAYAASKAAVLGLARAMAAYYAPYGVRVNAVAPGLVRTPMSQRAHDDPAIAELLATRQPLTGALLDPVAVARAALFLLGDDAAAVTGDALFVDGGWSLGG
jgi:NAD(P)-dependent dehydrogenase (short-subunit alcohol dehydrogenase family)